MTQAILQTWEKTFRYQVVTRMQTWGRFGSHLSDVLRTVAQRAYTSLSVNKEEEIRAWWRVQQEEKQVFWTRRGYSDAQHGNNGYPHHGTCYCALCQAYWAGYFRFQHGESQEVTRHPIQLSPLGYLSPPPRKEVLSRAAKSLAHAKKAKATLDVVIQTHPGMFLASFDKMRAEFNNRSPETISSLLYSMGSSDVQSQGQWELPFYKKVDTLQTKKPWDKAITQFTKSAKVSRSGIKKKQTTPTSKGPSKQSKLSMSA